ncbi:MAG: MotA/TolQ/ExbB proton channel family protein [Pirellulaceae bacterium]
MFRQRILIGLTMLALVWVLPTMSDCFAQNDVALGPSGEVGAPSIGEASQSSILGMLYGGSWLGDLVVTTILILSLVSAYFIIDHFVAITRRRIMPKCVLDELERLIIHGETKRAVEYCRDPKNYSVSTEVVLAGLERFHNNEFGFAEYRSACEEAGEDQTSRLYRRTEVLSVIGAIAPMLGLTGTVLGMIEAFNTIAAKEGMAQPQELAGGIGEALITTLLGLFVAIPTMVALSYFRARIDSLVSEAGKRIEQIMMPLGRKKPMKRAEG